MQFLYTSFLLAAAAIAIPILIHLFYFRRFKKVMFSNVRFLKEIKEETSSRSKLKNLLILAMRIFAILCLVAAFAMPFFPVDQQVKQGSKEVSIYVDNSFSMQAEADNVKLLDLAKSKASSIVNAYGDNTKFQILSNDLLGKQMRLLSKNDALVYIEEIQASAPVQPLSVIVNRQKQILQGENRIIYLISDFQKNVTDLTVAQDSLWEINMIPLQASLEKNVAIDSVWMIEPIPVIGKPVTLVAQYSNYSDEAVNAVKTSIWKDKQEKPLGVKDLQPRSKAFDTITLPINTAGIHEAEIRITDYPIQFDDRYYISFKVEEKIHVLALNDGSTNSRYLEAAFGSSQSFQFDQQNTAQIQYSSFSKYQLIICNELSQITSGLGTELKNYMAEGGKVLIIPNSKSNAADYNEFLQLVGVGQLTTWTTEKAEVSSINKTSFIFNEVFEGKTDNIKLPSVTGYFGTNWRQGSGIGSIMAFRNGKDFLAQAPIDEGILFIMTSPINPEISDLVQNAEIFVPMLFRMTIAGNRTEQIAFKMGVENLLTVQNLPTSNERIFEIKGQNGSFIPGQITQGRKTILSFRDQVREAGHFDLLFNQTLLDRPAFNYDRKESDQTAYTPSELEEEFGNDHIKVLSQAQINDINNFITAKDEGIHIWKWLLIAALVFLGLETLLIRMWKNS